MYSLQGNNILMGPGKRFMIPQNDRLINCIETEKEYLNKNEFVVRENDNPGFTEFTENNIENTNTINYYAKYKNQYGYYINKYYVIIKVLITGSDGKTHITQFIINKFSDTNITLIGPYTFNSYGYANPPKTTQLTEEKMAIIEKLINEGKINGQETQIITENDYYIITALCK